MLKIEIYNNGRILDIKATEVKKNKKSIYFINKNVVEFVQELQNEKISKVKVIGKDINFNASGVDVTIKDYDNVKNYPLFEVLKVKLNRVYRQEKLKKAKLNRLKLGTTAVLLSAGIAATSLLKENAKGINFSTIDNTDSLIIETSFDEVEEVNNLFFEEKEEQEQNQIIENVSLNEMLEKTYEFQIDLTYDDRSDSQKFDTCKEKYGDLITKYSNMYGLDANLMIALATQESGIHDPTNRKSGAVGLMQIEESVWKNKEITVYNYETKCDETFKITEDTMTNLETNIKIGCMIMRQQMDFMRNNPIAALQSYNMGYGNMDYILTSYAKDCGKSKKSVLDDYYDFGYITNDYYRNMINVGDSKYVEHVLSYLGDNPTISMYINDDTKLEININREKTSIRL